MGEAELAALVRIGQLNAEPATRAEFDGMVSGARKRLADAHNEDLAAESQFDLAHGAAHGFALAALRSKSHNERNLAEYEGRTEVDAQLLSELIRCTTALEKAVLALEPSPK
jgi:hypothetical protein